MRGRIGERLLPPAPGSAPALLLPLCLGLSSLQSSNQVIAGRLELVDRGEPRLWGERSGFSPGPIAST